MGRFTTTCRASVAGSVARPRAPGVHGYCSTGTRSPSAASSGLQPVTLPRTSTCQAAPIADSPPASPCSTHRSTSWPQPSRPSAKHAGRFCLAWSKAPGQRTPCGRCGDHRRNTDQCRLGTPNRRRDIGLGLHPCLRNAPASAHLNFMRRQDTIVEARRAHADSN